MKFNRKAAAVCLLLFLVLVIEIFWVFRAAPVAEPTYPISAVVTAKPAVQLRQEASTQKPALRSLNEHTRITVLGEVKGESVSGDNRWYQVQYGSLQGYVSALFVRLDSNVPVIGPLPDDAEFTAKLKALGFPADYQAKLLNLHRLYPKWTFTPLFTNYDFNTAVEGEYRPGVNMVPATAPDAYKSKNPAEYDMRTDTWLQYEPGWVGASKELIAYQMDPRNFLDDVQIFQFENQKFNPNIQSEEGVKGILNESFMASEDQVSYRTPAGDSRTLPLNYRGIVMEAAKQSNVSPYHLASRIRQEVSPKGSDSVSGQYRDLGGYYNFYNIGAYGGSDPVYQGLVTSKNGIKGYSASRNARLLFPWDSPYRAIIGGAIFLGEDYITVDQHTLYLQKFTLVSHYTNAFTHQYMGNVLAPEAEAATVYNGYYGIGALKEQKEFVIPVFTSMPAMVPEPTGNGNPNNYLKSISINGQKLEGFSPNVSEYRLNLGSSGGKIKISAETYGVHATVRGLGEYELKNGENQVLITVLASNGTERKYLLNLNYSQVSKPGTNPPVVIETPNTTKPDGSGAVTVMLDEKHYNINAFGFITGADPAGGYNQAKTIFTSLQYPVGHSAALLDKNNRVITGLVGTGDRLVIKKGEQIVASYFFLIFGDANGDGRIDIRDANEIFNYSLGKRDQSLEYQTAMDANLDGRVDIRDANIIFNAALGGPAVKQP